jgi:hypothetical protein
MAKNAVKPLLSGEAAFDRFLQFGSALFTVKKEDLPKRDEAAIPKCKPAKSRKGPA